MPVLVCLLGLYFIFGFFILCFRAGMVDAGDTIKNGDIILMLVFLPSAIALIPIVIARIVGGFIWNKLKKCKLWNWIEKDII